MQELATAFIDNLDIKILLLNNQHLGMVMQWEDRFYKANRAHTYLGKRESEYHLSKVCDCVYFSFMHLLGVSCVRPVLRALTACHLQANLPWPCCTSIPSQTST